MVIAAAAVLVVAIGLGARQIMQRRGATSSASAAADARRIAVLPFENLGDSADAYFVAGMTDAMRGKLTGLSELEVIARGSSTPYAGTTKTPKQIAAELGVRYLLTGTVRFDKRAGSAARVQVSPALVEIDEGGSAANRWQESFDADLSDVFKVQGEIAGKVVSAMRVALGGAAQAQLAEAPTANPAAYDAYLRGEAAWDAGSRTDPASASRAIPFFEQSVSLDPTFAGAWATLSRARSYYYSNARRADQALIAKALEAANKALALKPNDAGGLVALATFRRVVSSDPAAAQTLLERARQVAPNNALVLLELGSTQNDRGLLDDASRTLELAGQLDPRSVRIWVLRMRVALRRGDLQAASALGERLGTFAPGNLSGVLNRVLAGLSTGDLVKAQAVVASAAREVPIERIVAYLGQFNDVGWVLTPDQERVLLSLAPDAFDGDRAQWAIVRAEQYDWRGDTAKARIWGDSAARGFALQVRDAPSDPQLHVIHGLALALSGRRQDALREARAGLEGRPAGTELSNINSYVAYVAARVAVAAGDRGQALTWLSEARRRHYYASPAWIRLDPSFKPLLGDPKFEQVLATRY
jgi:TolB-like protein